MTFLFLGHGGKFQTIRMNDATVYVYCENNFDSMQSILTGAVQFLWISVYLEYYISAWWSGPALFAF